MDLFDKSGTSLCKKEEKSEAAGNCQTSSAKQEEPTYLIVSINVRHKKQGLKDANKQSAEKFVVCF